jgi:hypothetical protein
MNYKFYIQNKKKEMTYEDIERLLSKCSHWINSILFL